MTGSLLVLLPPSETKRDGGNTALRGRWTGCAPHEGQDARARGAGHAGVADAPGDALAWPRLERIRGSVARDLIALAKDPAATATALKVSPKLAEVEAARNRALRTAPRMPAARRYTGLLYDALDAESLDRDAWSWLARQVAVHSALYGLVGASEPIAAYRCSAGSRLPGTPLKARWREPIARALARHDGAILDLRSAAYAELGPAGPRSVSVDLVTDDGAGGERALNHFNKRAKGELVRAFATTPSLRALDGSIDADGLATALRAVGFSATALADDRIRLCVDDPVAASAAR